MLTSTASRHISASFLTALAAYCALAFVIMLPASAAPGRKIYGVPKPLGDTFGVVADAYWSGLSGGDGALPRVGAPFGRDKSLVPETPAYVWPLAVLSRALGGIMAFNLYIFLGMVFSAICGYVVAFVLCRNGWGAFVAGLTAGFSPYVYTHALAGHISLIHQQWLVLFTGCLLLMISRPVWTTALAAVAAMTLGVLFNLYNIIFFALLGLSWLAAVSLGLLLDCRSAHRWLSLAGCLVLATIVTVGLLVAINWEWVRELHCNLAAGTDLLQHRPANELTGLTARIWDYLLPSTYSLAGDGLLRRWGSDLHRHYWDRSLFLGWSLLAVTLSGLWLDRANWWPPGRTQALARWFLALTIAGALLLSLSPRLEFMGLSLPNPNQALFGFAPMFRALGRFGAMVGCLMGLLAALAVTALMQRLRPGWPRRMAGFLLCLVLAAEYAVLPPVRAIDRAALDTPVTQWLAARPGAPIVAYYPMVPESRSDTQYYRFHATLHGKPILNGTTAYSLGDLFRVKLAELNAADTASTLAGLGVKYVLLERKYYLKHAPPGFLESVGHMPGFQALRQDDSWALFKVTAAPQGVVWAVSRGNCKAKEPGRGWQCYDGKAEVAIYRASPPSRVTLSFQAMSRSPGTVKLESPQTLLGEWPLVANAKRAIKIDLDPPRGLSGFEVSFTGQGADSSQVFFLKGLAVTD